MNVITLDFETYYDTGFSLSRLTTEEYIRSPEFEMIGVGVKVNDASTYWVSGSRETIFNSLKKLPWRDSMLLCHNTMFDGAILAWFCKISPAMYLDTLCMARALHGIDAGGSLKTLAERYEIGEKGEEVIHAKGKRLADFSPEELHRYGQYCINDVELTHKLFSKMGKHFSQQEIRLIDTTIRMFTHPMMYIDTQLLQERLTELKQQKQDLLAGLTDKLKCADEEEVRQKLASQKMMRVSSRLRNTKTHSFNIYAACDSALSPPSKNPVYKDLLTWRPAITTVCPSPLSITALIPGVGLGPTRSTSKTSQAETRKRKHLRMQSWPRMVTSSSTPTRLRSKHVSLSGLQGKPMSYKCLQKAAMFTLNLLQKSTRNKYQRPTRLNVLLERLAFLDWVMAQEQKNSSTP
jgi:DNA polymerase III epsilon subunit-like protein